MKKILLCTDGSAYSQVGYEYAAWLAQKMNFEIEVLYVTDRRAEKAVKTPDFSGNIGIDSYQKLLRELVDIEAARAKINHERAKIILQQAKAFFSDRQLDRVKLTHETGFLVDLFHQLEDRSDLVILGKRGEQANFATEHLGANMERIVRSSTKPCLVTPREFQPIDRVLLAYDGGESCQKALDYLVKLSVFKDLELHVVYVTRRERDKGKEYLRYAENKLKAAGLKPICQMLQGEPEPEIEKYAAEKYIDLLLMGAYGHNRIRYLVIGSTTAQMLRSSHLPVFLFR